MQSSFEKFYINFLNPILLNYFNPILIKASFDIIMQIRFINAMLCLLEVLSARIQ